MTQLGLDGMVSRGKTAVLSPDGLYRYRLGRPLGPGPTMLWVMLNPSIADADIDDPTIRKCTGFAKRWGFGGYHVVNLFAFRATQPEALAHALDPVGPQNDFHLISALGVAQLVVVAWGRAAGVPAKLMRSRVARVRELLPSSAECLGRCEDGQPRHPLMLAYNTDREIWTP